MKRCRDLRPSLFRAVEGDLAPAESLRLARHLDDCTACKIVLARERRLAQALDGMLDRLPVDAAFVDRVMAELPPPPARPVVAAPSRRRRRRGLRLVSLLVAGIAGGSAALLAGGWLSGWHPRAVAALPGDALPSPVDTATTILEIGAAAISNLVAGLPVEPLRPAWAPGMTAPHLTVAAAAAAIAMAAAAAYGARALARSRSSAR